jgi:hypothetical protein
MKHRPVSSHRKNTPQKPKRHEPASVRWLRNWLKQVERWESAPRFLGWTFPDLKDGDKKAEEFLRGVRTIISNYDRGDSHA